MTPPTVVRRLAVDVSPLRESPPFRRIFLSSTVSQLGTQMTAVAVPVQVFAITRSSFAVGLIGLVAVVPLVTFGLLGGAIADSVDRRLLTMVTSSALAVLSLLLVVQAAAGWNRLPLLYGVIGLQAGLFAVDSPARNTFAPRLLPAHQLPAATALGQIGFNAGFTLGPLLAGVLIGSIGLFAAYLVDVLSFAFALYALVRLPPMPPAGGGAKMGLGSVAEGFRFLRTQRVLLMTFLVDINAMVFGMPRALFPALALSFGGGPRTVGLLYSAPACGALLGALVSGPLGRVRRQGLAVLLAIVAWGLAITAFGLTDVLWLGLVFLALAGAADMVSSVFRNTILQVATPDELRGRLNGVFIVVVAGGPRLGDLESGSVAALVSPTFSVVSGGLACVVVLGLLAAAVPSFARYDARHPTA